MNAKALWRRIRRIWITVGLLATAVFVSWSLIAYRASSEAQAAMTSGEGVSVEQRGGIWRFVNTTAPSAGGPAFIFFPGALVDPRAYAPLLRAVALAGFPAFLIELPRRGAFGGGEDPQVDASLGALLQRLPPGTRVALAGHSLGAVVASRSAARPAPQLGGLILIGSTHPRDVDLSELTIPVTKIVGTLDGIASPAEVERNAGKLPRSTRWVWVDGGNHSQFGWYGFQPGDWPARIEAPRQRAIMIEAVLELLRRLSVPAQPA